MLNLPQPPTDEPREQSPSGAPYPEKSWLDQKIGQLAHWMGQPQQQIMMGANPIAMVESGGLMGSAKLRALAEQYRSQGKAWPRIGLGKQGEVARIPEDVTASFGMPPGLTIKEGAGPDVLREGYALRQMQNAAPGSTKPYVGTVATAKGNLPQMEPGMDPVNAMPAGRMQPSEADTSFLFSRYVPEGQRSAPPLDKMKELAAAATRRGLAMDVGAKPDHVRNVGGNPVVMDLGGWVPFQSGKPLHNMNMNEAKGAVSNSAADWARRQLEHDQRNAAAGPTMRKWLDEEKAKRAKIPMSVWDDTTGQDVPMLPSDWLKLRHEWR